MAERDVQILMGSNSDAPVMRKAVEVLGALGVTSHMTVASAHRSPARVQRIIEESPGRGVKVFIVGAGAAAHLAGVVAAHSTLPVIGVPIDSSPLEGWDALLATVQMPPGYPWPRCRWVRRGRSTPPCSLRRFSRFPMPGSRRTWPPTRQGLPRRWSGRQRSWNSDRPGGTTRGQVESAGQEEKLSSASCSVSKISNTVCNLVSASRSLIRFARPKSFSVPPLRLTAV